MKTYKNVYEFIRETFPIKLYEKQNEKSSSLSDLNDEIDSEFRQKLEEILKGKEGEGKK